MNTQQTIRVGVIGTGFGSIVQIPGFQRSPGVEVVAVASGRESRAHEIAQQFNVPAAYGDYRQMLAEQELDLVSIVTPPYLHHEMTLATLERRRNVLCEKPFAANLGQAREMLAAAEQAGVVHAIDHEFRYLPARVKMKELIEQGYLGELRTVRVSVLSDMLITPERREWSWWFERSKCGGLLGAFASHQIDGLIWWFGDIVEVAAQLDTFIKQRPLPGGGEWREVTSDDQVSALFRFKNGASAHLFVTGVAYPPSQRIEAHGSEGSLIIDETLLLGARGQGSLETIDLPPAPALDPGDDGRISPFLTFLGRFLPHLRGQGGPDVPTFREGLRVQAVMDAIHESSEQKKFVSVSL